MAERAVACVDIGAIERNCRLLDGVAGDAELCVVVKADGYGHGATPCARAALAGGATRLATATAMEAAALREEGVDAPILVMGALTPDEARLALRSNAEIVAWEPEFVASLEGPGRVHVKYDTGMGRLGAKQPEQVSAVADAVAAAGGLELAGLMTHFATADEPGDDWFPEQLRRFTGFAAAFGEAHPGVPVHAANSAATFRDPAAHFDFVRCGVAVYGLDPFQEDPTARGLEPALTLESWVAAVRRFEPGDSAGYGRRWRAEQPTWVGTVPIGYGDGWRRALTNNAQVLVGGLRRPLVGTVSMDNVTIDLGSETDVKPGDPAVLIGAQGGERILCEEVARAIGTINYEITCGLTPRVRREWTS